ncbi:Nn.00g032200.m01.CDS01 [Neocucurbitaria sp. VM-36]
MSSSPSPFDPKSYYRFSNTVYTGVTISTGYKNSSPLITFTPSGSRSSENWQLYRQNDRYLIRNYDYGAELQLGLTKASDAVPKLLPRSGELGQQWVLVQTEEDGSWRMTNALLGSGAVLGVSDGISNQEVEPAMNPSPDDSERWIVTVNLSAGEIVDQDMLTDIEDLEEPSSVSSTQSSTPAASAIPSTTGASNLSAGAPIQPVPSIATTSTLNSIATTLSNSSAALPTDTFSSAARPMHTPPQFPACDIAGKYVAISALMLFLVVAALFWKRRSRNSYRSIPSLDVGFEVDSPVNEK